MVTRLAVVSILTIWTWGVISCFSTVAQANEPDPLQVCPDFGVEFEHPQDSAESLEDFSGEVGIDQSRGNWFSVSQRIIPRGFALLHPSTYVMPSEKHFVIEYEVFFEGAQYDGVSYESMPFYVFAMLNENPQLVEFDGIENLVISAQFQRGETENFSIQIDNDTDAYVNDLVIVMQPTIQPFDTVHVSRLSLINPSATSSEPQLSFAPLPITARLSDPAASSGIDFAVLGSQDQIITDNNTISLRQRLVDGKPSYDYNNDGVLDLNAVLGYYPDVHANID